jgi:hypothetical protein
MENFLDGTSLRVQVLRLRSALIALLVEKPRDASSLASQSAPTFKFQRMSLEQPQIPAKGTRATAK